MSFIIRHQQKGKSEAQILIQSRKEEEMTKVQLLALGQKTKDEMINIISQNSKEPASANGLRNSIKLYPFAKGGFGIGKISELPEYWKGVNYGHSGYGIQIKNAQFLRFKDKSGKIIYRKSVKGHSISPMNFVEKSVMYLMLKLSSIK